MKRDAIILLVATGILTVLAYNGKYSITANLSMIHDLITTEIEEVTSEIDEISTEEIEMAFVQEYATEALEMTEKEIVSEGYVMYSSIWDKVQMTFYEDGTCVFELPKYEVSEACTWTYQEGVLTVIRQDGVVFTSYTAENGESLKLDYQAIINEQLIGQLDSKDYKTFFEKE